MSPPLIFPAAVIGTWTGGSSNVSFVVPSNARPGETLELILAFKANTTSTIVNVGGVPLASSGWTQSAIVTTAANRIIILRKIATDSEPASIVVTFTGTPDGMGALLVIRQAHPSILETGLAANDFTANTSYTAPAQTKTIFSQRHIGLTMAEVSYSPSLASQCQSIVSGSSGTLGLLVFQHRISVDGLSDLPGTFGPHTASNGASRTGVAASFLITAVEVARSKLSLPSPPGSIGLPLVGV